MNGRVSLPWVKMRMNSRVRGRSRIAETLEKVSEWIMLWVKKGGEARYLRKSYEPELEAEKVHPVLEREVVVNRISRRSSKLNKGWHKGRGLWV